MGKSLIFYLKSPIEPKDQCKSDKLCMKEVIKNKVPANVINMLGAVMYGISKFIVLINFHHLLV